MFDFAWSEIALIGAVALIAIGPKDMPAAIRTITGMIKKARRMAAEFQTHVDEMIREADLGDVKKAFNEVRNFDIAGTMERTIDPDRSLRRTFQEDPFKPTYPTSTAPAPAPEAAEVSTLDKTAVATLPRATATAEAMPAAGPSDTPSTGPDDAVKLAAAPLQRTPDWLPPNLAPAPKVAAAAEPPEAPAWIPPAIVAQRRDKA